MTLLIVRLLGAHNEPLQQLMQTIWQALRPTVIGCPACMSADLEYLITVYKEKNKMDLTLAKRTSYCFYRRTGGRAT